MKNKKLVYMYSDLLQEWDFGKNKEVDPYEISYGSSLKVWWKCSKGHRWVTSIAMRTRQNTKCPYCQNKKACIDNCLATKRRDLIKEWHPNKNGKLTPYDVLPNSGRGGE